MTLLSPHSCCPEKLTLQGPVLTCFFFLSPWETSSTDLHGHGKDFSLAKPNCGSGGSGTEIAPRLHSFPVQASECPFTQCMLPHFAAQIYPFVKLLVATAPKRKQQDSPE